MEQDSEMQRVVEGLDSYEAASSSQLPGTTNMPAFEPFLIFFFT